MPEAETTVAEELASPPSETKEPDEPVKTPKEEDWDVARGDAQESIESNKPPKAKPQRRDSNLNTTQSLPPPVSSEKSLGLQFPRASMPMPQAPPGAPMGTPNTQVIGYQPGQWPTQALQTSLTATTMKPEAMVNFSPQHASGVSGSLGFDQPGGFEGNHHIPPPYTTPMAPHPDRSRPLGNHNDNVNGPASSLEATRQVQPPTPTRGRGRGGRNARGGRGDSNGIRHGGSFNRQSYDHDDPSQGTSWRRPSFYQQPPQPPQPQQPQALGGECFNRSASQLNEEYHPCACSFCDGKNRSVCVKVHRSPGDDRIDIEKRLKAGFGARFGAVDTILRSSLETPNLIFVK